MTRTLGPQAPPSPPAIRTNRRANLTFKNKLGRLDVKYSPYLYVAPFFVLFALVGLFPLVYTFVVSLNNWNLLSGPGEWVGFGNFVKEFNDPLFWNSLFNTISIFLLSSIPQLIAATFIAAVLDQNLRTKTFWRMSVLIPYVVTPVAVALIFSNMFSEEGGLVNHVLSLIGLDPIAWKLDTLPSHIAIASMVNWRWTGYNALILLAAMQAVPRDIHESAALDGAGSLRRFFSITLPSIRPTMIFVILTATIGGLQIFTEPRLYDATSVTGGGAHRQFQTTVLYLWEMAFQRQNFGRAAAIAWILFVIIVLFGVLNYMISQRIASSESRAISKRRKRKLDRYNTDKAAAEHAVAVGRVKPGAEEHPR
jgi:cellobiose transport system permease protein